MKYAVLLSSVLAACGSSGGTTQNDAAGSGSGTVNKVTTVACAGATIAATVMMADGTNQYTYSTTTAPTIAVGGIVEFKTSGTHDVNPSLNTNSDPGLKVTFNKDVCLKFTEAGTFTFFCSVHLFTGTVTAN
jgi:plastocyanin